jgi:hypothetical protein
MGWLWQDLKFGARTLLRDRVEQSALTPSQILWVKTLKEQMLRK